MKTYMPLNGLRWSRNSGSANCDMPQSAVFGRPGGVNVKTTSNTTQTFCTLLLPKTNLEVILNVILRN